MIDFKEEIKKYKPVLETEQIEESINSNETLDLMEILQTLTKQLNIYSE